MTRHDAVPAAPAEPETGREAARARRRAAIASWTAIAGVALNLWVRLSSGITGESLPQALRAGLGASILDVLLLRNGLHMLLPFALPGVFFPPALIWVVLSALLLLTGKPIAGIALFAYYVLERLFMALWVVGGHSPPWLLVCWLGSSIAYGVVFFLGIRGAATMRRLRARGDLR